MTNYNPAWLLHDLLRDARDTKAARANGPFMSAWSEVFQAEDAELARSLNGLQTLIEEVRETIVALPNMDPATITPAMDLLMAGFLREPSLVWPKYWSAIGGEGTLRLVMAFAGFIDSATPDDERFPIVEVNRLRERLLELYEEVAASADLPDRPRRIVLEHIRQMLAAIDNPRVKPTTRLRSVLLKLVGRLGIDTELAEDLERTETGKKILSAVAAFVFAHAVVTGESILPVLQDKPADPIIVQCLIEKETPAITQGTQLGELTTGDGYSSR